MRSPVVVGEGVEIEVLGEAIEAHGDAGRPFEVFLVHALVHLEGLARLVEPGGDRVFWHAVHAVVQVVHLQDLDVEAELGLVHGEVRVHVKHPRVGVPEEAEAAPAQRPDHCRRVAPLLYLRPGVFVFVERA